jgi:hypothetical protein
MAKEKEVIGTSEIAKRLKIDPKQFRKILRSQASKANGGARYEFTEADLPKATMFDQHVHMVAHKV